MNKNQSKIASKFLFKMFEIETEEQIDNLLDAYTTSSSKINRTELLEKINSELEIFLSQETNETDSIDDIFDFLKDLSDVVQEKFEELIAGDSDKKCFVRALSRIFALLLNTKVDTPEKIKRIIKIAIDYDKNNTCKKKI